MDWTLLAEAASDGQSVTLTVGSLVVLAGAITGYATLRAQVAQLAKDQEADRTALATANRTIARLVRWRERIIGAAAARREDSDVHRTVSDGRIEHDSEGD